jgi:alginate O-acetyltransferase complex protein AlgI
MMFHSYQFIFGFLPLTFLVFCLAVHLRGWQAGLVTLGLASVVFYGQFSVALAAMLVGSIIVNFGFVRLLEAHRDRKRLASMLFSTAVVGNLGYLGYFKYANFFIDNLNAAGGLGIPYLAIILPVGISFYTFVQIGFLAEVHAGQVRGVKFSHYFLFSSFFPCVTAGPILLQKEMMPQFTKNDTAVWNSLRISVALTVFTIGLFKKLVLGDSIAPYADLVFNGVADGAVVSAGAAWIGALAYTLQLYFDFSGYSDMALGIGYLFGLRLPLNFNSPLKATSIIDFWRRWHMTMTRFFTNFLYTPIGIPLMRRAIRNGYSPGTRFLVAVAGPITLTMVLAGLWHGAGWTFVVFGLLHGLALAVNHAWRQYGPSGLPRPAGWLMTMAVVVTGMVIFRAADLSVAGAMLASMTGLASLTGSAPAIAAAVTGGAVTVDAGPALALIVALGSIALVLPNTQELMRDHIFSSDGDAALAADRGSRVAWRPSVRWAAATGALLVLALGLVSGDSTFIYYQF